MITRSIRWTTGAFASPVCFCSTMSRQSSLARFLSAKMIAVEAPGPALPLSASLESLRSQKSWDRASEILLASRNSG